MSAYARMAAGRRSVPAGVADSLTLRSLLMGIAPGRLSRIRESADKRLLGARVMLRRWRQQRRIGGR